MSAFINYVSKTLENPFKARALMIKHIFTCVLETQPNIRFMIFFVFDRIRVVVVGGLVGIVVQKCELDDNQNIEVFMVK